MTQRVVRLFLVAGMAALLVSSAQAQQPPQRGRGNFQGGAFGGGPAEQMWLTLLRAEPVVKELELVDDQKAKLRTAGEEIAAKMREAGGGQPGRRGGNQNQTEEERAKERAERDKRNLENGKMIRTKIGEILLPHQLERLEEIALQVRGVRALQDAAIAKELGITEDQKAQFTKIEEEARGQRGAGGGAGGFDIEAFRKRQQEQNEKTLAVLTPDQKAKFEKMQGEKFNIDLQALLGAGRRGGTNNNNNN